MFSSNYINKKITFPQTKITIKINQLLYSYLSTQIYLTNDINSPNKLYYLKMFSLPLNSKISYENCIFETSILKLNEHEKIINFIDYYQMFSKDYIIFSILISYPKKGTLYNDIKNYIRNNQFMSNFLIFSYLLNTANILEILHKNNIIHRDISPENLLIDENFNIKIGFFNFSIKKEKNVDNSIMNDNNNNNLVNKILNISKNTNYYFRAPEENDIYSLENENNINEKVDIYALGCCLLMMIFNYDPYNYNDNSNLYNNSNMTNNNMKLNFFFEFKNFPKKLRKTFFEQISQFTVYSELLDNILKEDPNERFSATEIINYLNINKDKFLLNDTPEIQKLKLNFCTNFNSYFQKFINNHNIKIICYKTLINKNYLFPNSNLISNLFNKFKIKNYSKNIINKFYKNLTTNNIFNYTFSALKAIYLIHYVIFYFNNNNKEIYESKMVESILNLMFNVFNYRLMNQEFERYETIKNNQIINFLLRYIEYIQVKVVILKQYGNFIQNDYTFIIKNNNFYSNISKKFIYDILYLYTFSIQLTLLIPFGTNLIINTLDRIAHLLIEEFYSIFQNLFYFIIDYNKKNFNDNKNNQEFIDEFIKSSKEGFLFLKKIKNFRKSINSDLHTKFFTDENNFNLSMNYLSSNQFQKNNFYLFNEVLFNIQPKFIYENNYSEQINNNNQFNENNNNDDNDIINENEKINTYTSANSSNSENNNNNDEMNKIMNDMIGNCLHKNNNSDSFNSKNSNSDNDIYNSISENNKIDSNNKSISTNAQKSTNIITTTTQTTTTKKNSSMKTTTDSAKKFLNSIITKPSNQFFLNSFLINSNKNISNLDYGGSSHVFKTNYRGTEVAIKELLITKNSCRHTLKLFKREISTLQLILHPNLVLFMGAIAEPNKLCIITEYCSGGTLYNFLQNKQNKISWKFRLRILYEIAITMNFLHLNKPQILHRDLKTSNILLTENINGMNNECSIKINDFGLSKIINSIDMSKSGSDCIGTVEWMAPEVIKNNKYSNKCDVYSFGIIMWEIATRKKLYEKMNQSQIIYKVCFEKGRPEMEDWENFNPPKDYRELMEKCWDDDENKRPDFKEIIEDIKKIREKYYILNNINNS